MMKAPTRTFVSLLVLLGCLGATAFLPAAAPPDGLAIGDAAPLTDVALADPVAGGSHTLADLAGPNGLLVIFSCNTCPWVARWEDRYLTTAALAEELGVGMVLLNPNEALRDGPESGPTMKARHAGKGYRFPYLIDQDARLARAYGATRTPDVFLFDADLRLVYRGAIDDNARDADAVEQAYLADALHAMHAGEPIAMQETASLGCTIKWPN